MFISLSLYIYTSLPLYFYLVYTIAYGVPEVKDSKEGLKVGLTTLSLIGVAVGLFAFLRTFGKLKWCRNLELIIYLFYNIFTHLPALIIISAHNSQSTAKTTGNKEWQRMPRKFFALKIPIQFQEFHQNLLKLIKKMILNWDIETEGYEDMIIWQFIHILIIHS